MDISTLLALGLLVTTAGTNGTVRDTIGQPLSGRSVKCHTIGFNRESDKLFLRFDFNLSESHKLTARRDMSNRPPLTPGGRIAGDVNRGGRSDNQEIPTFGSHRIEIARDIIPSPSANTGRGGSLLTAQFLSPRDTPA